MGVVVRYSRIIRDQLKSQELWNPFVEAWFPEGPQDPNIVLIRVQADTAEYWDSPWAVGTVLSLAKTKLTGKRYDGGDNETVQL